VSVKKSKIIKEAEICKNLTEKFDKKKTAKIVVDILKEANKIKITDDVLNLIFNPSK
jgi:hypothetical protein